MMEPIPPGAESIHIPHVGHVAVFRDGAAWHAVLPDFGDDQSRPSGSGVTPLEAVADLLMAQ